jgi:putative FmdB family regulatory protein
MPIYEYECLKCSKTFEKVQKITAPAEATCVSCGSTEVKRLISRSNFVLKGSGWYVTDYANRSKNRESSTSESGKSSKASPSAATEKSKPQESSASESGKSSKASSGDSGEKSEHKPSQSKAA